MQIAFSRISNVAYPFDLNYENLHFSGKLLRKDAKLINCSGAIIGTCETPCASCGEPVACQINLDVNLDLSDGVFKDLDNELSDTMEFFNHEIDLAQVLNSELELYLSDYFYCENCK